MKFITYSHIGKRAKNEDFVYTKELNPDNWLAIIADGMGGYTLGDKAAQLVIFNIETYLQSINTDEFTQYHITNAIKKANLALKNFNEYENIKSGATIAGAIINMSTTKIFWVGDVIIDLYYDNKLIFRSEPHTLIQQLKQQLKILSIDMIEKYSHIVTKSISGSREIIDFGYKEFNNNIYNRLIISSDGVHNIIDTSQLFSQQLKAINTYLELNAKDNHTYLILEK